MALSESQMAALQAVADREGVDVEQLVAAAERGDSGEVSVRPTAERLLIGFLPFIKVHELRSLWLGLDERIPDDEMTCGEYAMKHGGEAPAKEPEE